MRKQLKITIDEDGNAEVDVNGFDGRKCLEVTHEIEEAIGEVEDRQRKTSFYRTSQSSRERASRGE